MTALNATLLTLAIGDNGNPEHFTELGGVQTYRMNLRNNIARHHHANLQHRWQESLDQSGTQVLTLSADGIFSDSASEESLRALAFAGESRNYRISLGNGDTLIGAFTVNQFERNAQMEGAIHYRITLQSAGELTYSAAT